MDPNAQDDFYIGYASKMPPRYFRVMVLVGVLGLAGTLFLGLSIGRSFHYAGPGTFEYGVTRSFEGWIVEAPYPMLRVAREGQAYRASPYSLYPLVRFGKRGPGKLTEGLDGMKVRIEASLIYREDQVMLEMAGPPVPMEDPESAEFALIKREESEMTFEGEIVDAKCYYGVMKPGNLKPHKACAVRCISGGIPPVLAVTDAQGNARYFILAGPDGRAINKEVLPYVAEPVRIRGKAVGMDNIYFLYIDPKKIKVLTKDYLGPLTKGIDQEQADDSEEGED